MGIAVVSALRLAAPKDKPLIGFQRSWLFAIIMSLLALIAMVALFRKPTADEIEASRMPSTVRA